MESTTKTRQAIIDGCLWMGQVGLNQGTSGNISVRVPSGMLITPSAVPYADMTPDMICGLPLDGEPAQGQRPSTEWHFHQAILRARPDVNAVVHAHPVHVTSVAMQRRKIPAVHYMVAAFGGYDVPLADYALFGTTALSDNVVTVLSDRHACLMANHGAVAVGDTIEKALWRMQELETLAQMMLLSEQSGTPFVLSDSQIDEVLAAFDGYGLRSDDP